MIVVELPELDIDNVEVFIAKEVRIPIDIWFSFYVSKALEDIGIFELPMFQ